jgi:hypothetical protein
MSARARGDDLDRRTGPDSLSPMRSSSRSSHSSLRQSSPASPVPVRVVPQTHLYPYESPVPVPVRTGVFAAVARADPDDSDDSDDSGEAMPVHQNFQFPGIESASPMQRYHGGSEFMEVGPSVRRAHSDDSDGGNSEEEALREEAAARKQRSGATPRSSERKLRR